MCSASATCRFRARSREPTAATLLFLAAVIAACPRHAFAHETDQYSVPAGKEFADLDEYFSIYFRNALTKALRKINDPFFGQHLLFPSSEQDRIAWHVLWQFPPDLIFVERLEGQLKGRNVAAQFPGRLVLYRPERWIYHHWALVIDPTKLVRLKRCATVRADGVYFGTDKIAHFVHLGYLYYRAYRGAIDLGADEQAAVRRAISVGTGANLVTSERALFGLVATGVLSNADLAVNYLGFKFFRNLTEPMVLEGKVHPALLVREGKKWRLSNYVKDNDRWFSVYLSDHWDEALNPSDYVKPTATFVREEVRSRCDSVVAWYRDHRRDLQIRDEFAQLVGRLATYFGEAYGHTLPEKDAITIANLCFQNQAADTE